MSGINGQKHTYTQDSGPDVDLWVFGDEFYARRENDDGYTVVYDFGIGLFCYAILVDGEFVSSETPMTEDPPPRLRRHLRESPEVRGRRFERRYAMVEPPPMPGPPIAKPETLGQDRGLLSGRKLFQGQVKGITVLVEFQDCEFEDDPEVTRQRFDDLMNKKGFNENGNACSVRDYFLTMSLGKLDYSNEVFGPFKLSRNRGKYHHTQTNEILKEVLEFIDENAGDLSRFDYDGDDVIEAITIVYAGKSQFIPNSWLWPHNFTVQQALGSDPLLGGLRTRFYMVSGAGDLSIGTICHENGHMLCRFPDLYDYGTRDGDMEDSAGLGYYCLMSAGNHLDRGKTPASVCAYYRYLAGWFDEEISLNEPGSYEVEQGDYSKIHVYRLPYHYDEYFIVENRFRRGLDKYLPSSGLAVYHCDINGSNEWQHGTRTHHYQCALLQADGHKDLESNVNRGDSGDLFGKSSGTVLAYDTKPSSKRWDRSDSGLVIANVSKAGRRMTFETLPGK